MMKTKLILLLAVILSAAAFASAQTDSKTEQALINNEKAAWQNLVNKKYDDFGKLLADDFQGVYSWGVFAKTDEMASVKQVIFKSADVSDVKVKMIDANSAIVTATVKSEMIFPDGKTMTQNVRTTSVVVKRGKQWLCIYHSQVPIETT